MERIICVLIGYAFGLLQTGYLYGKAVNIDIRNHGSGNTGTTNAIRTLGWSAGIVIFLGDCFKCIFAVIVVRLIYADVMPGALPLLGLYAGLGAVLGHNFPFYLKFKGGKGVATSVGLAIATNIWVAIVATLTFYIVVKVTRYVSVSSMVMLAVFAIGTMCYGEWIGFDLATVSMKYEMYVLVIGIFLLSVVRHKANIIRLMNGTENKTKSKEEKLRLKQEKMNNRAK